VTTVPHGTIRGWRALGLTLAIAAGLLALATGLRVQYTQWLAEHWRKQLETVPDDQAAQLLHQVAELGEPGIPVLVEALGSQRQSVAKCGRRVLLAEIHRWEALRARESSPKLAALARALADRVDEFGPAAQADAADLAARILHWPLDNRVVDRTEVIASCHTVLRVATLDRRHATQGWPWDRPEQVALGDGQGTAGLAGLNGGRTTPRPIAVDSADPLPGLAGLPGGGLPLETSPSGAGTSPPPILGGPPLDQPRRLLGAAEQVEPAPPYAGAVNVPQPSSPPLPQTGASGGQTPDAAGDSSNGDDGPAPWSAVETVEIMRRLHAEDDSLAAAAEVELRRRGFSPVHVELARQLFDPSVHVRRQLARLLPELGSVDAVPWLMRLSRDEDAGVRRVAITLLATTGDPTLLAELEQIARRDPDPSIQRQAEQIARQRQQRRH